jgi:hypothetical protein
MPTTYEPIATTTLGAAAASITLSSIPATYTDLKWILILPNTVLSSGADIFIRYNSDSSSLYSTTSFDGDGASASSARVSNDDKGRASFQMSYPSTTQPFFLTGDIFSYAGATNKTSLQAASGDRNGSGGGVSRNVILYRSTSAINSINLFFNTANYAAGTTLTLYGIKNA